ncbi:Chitinase [Purpureocillium takamizusanense]|uniref:chitinase n=1 Tax=Purpureocillium takamizusanense TaxID=2060973 RepID=A0A9Q8QM21_9HYPO|nr:Chitinase [Purpureocillium takamizusanense]UNI20977.1 Chitinase [Purpureocillium takamizusanense]
MRMILPITTKPTTRLPLSLRRLNKKRDSQRPQRPRAQISAPHQWEIRKPRRLRPLRRLLGQAAQSATLPRPPRPCETSSTLPTGASTEPTTSRTCCRRTGSLTSYTPLQLLARTGLCKSHDDCSSQLCLLCSSKTFDSYADVEKHYPDDSWNDKGKNAYGCVKQLYKLKQANRRLKTLISIGGWNASLNGKFANSVATDAQKQKFAETAVKLMGDWGMDGLDVDWEYPTSDTEAKSFVALLQACRKALDDYAEKNAPGYHFLLTVATSAGPDHYRQLDMKGMDQYLDAWHLMAYDYAGSWDKTTGHQANINKSSSNPEATKFSTVQAVDDYIQAGIAPDKIVLGLPLYGRSFANTNGLGESFTGVGGGTLEKGVWLYRDLPRPSAKVEMDDAVGAVWSYDASAKELVSYDDPRSAKMKVDYLKSKGLGGALFWEASGDKNKTDPDNIVSTVATSLGELENSQNQLSYPGSQYDNIKNGMKG